jgi:hypothetical protein
MKFDNIELADGISGARDGQGMKRGENHYVTSSGYGIGISGDSADTDTDYYVVWNEWPTFTGSNGDTFETVSSTALNDIGISRLDIRAKATHTADTSLDVAIIRKSDRKGIRITVTGNTAAHYKGGNAGTSIGTKATITAIDPKDGPRTPETGRLFNLGYV